MIIKLVLLNVIIAYCFYSGFVDSLKRGISSLLTKGKVKSSDWQLKPFTCCTCLTFWGSIILLLLFHQFSLLGVVFCCLNSYLVNYTIHLFRLAEGALNWLINKIYDWLG